MSSEIRTSQRINRSNLSRVLRLTLLAPEIVEAILDGRQPAELQLDDLLRGFPVEWPGQRSAALNLHVRGILVPSAEGAGGEGQCAHS